MNQTAKIEHVLGKLGLTEEEVLMYQLLLGRGVPLSVSDLSKESGLYRPVVYRAIGALLDRHLVSPVARGKRKEYAAEPPEKLRGMIREISIDVEEVIPDLEDIYNAPKEKPFVRLLEGKKGISFVFSDVVDTLGKGELFYRYSSRSGEANDEYLPKDYRKKRDAKGLQRMVITSSRLERVKKPSLNRTVKTVPEQFDPFDQDILVLIYGNKVATIDLAKQTTLLVENRQLADFQKKVFKLLYEKL